MKCEEWKGIDTEHEFIFLSHLLNNRLDIQIK